MRSGTKNAIVSIFRNTQTVHPDYNSPVYTLTAWKEGVFANIVPRRGREVALEGQITAESYVRFDFDYYDVEGILETDVIQHEGLNYDVKAVLPDLSTKEYITVDATRRTAPTERV